jgi:hypothetical protein
MAQKAKIYSLSKLYNFNEQMQSFYEGVWNADHMRAQFISKTAAAFAYHWMKVLLLNSKATIYEEHLNKSFKHTDVENKRFFGGKKPYGRNSHQCQVVGGNEQVNELCLEKHTARCTIESKGFPQHHPQKSLLANDAGFKYIADDVAELLQVPCRIYVK